VIRSQTNGCPSIVLACGDQCPRISLSLSLGQGVGAPSLLSPVLSLLASNSHACRPRLCCAVAHLLLSSLLLACFSNPGLYAIHTREYSAFRRSIIARQHGTLSAYGTAKLARCGKSGCACLKGIWTTVSGYRSMH
jgi:hypothetical protein